MNISGDGTKPKELRHQFQGETKRDGDAVLSEYDFQVNDPAETIRYRHGGALQAPPASLQISQQQQSQGSVCWERFLHLRSLKVLLVEKDYSTRHVVTALLHNCNYEVTEAANGFQAWKILEDPTNQIDLVLTEVVMPGLTGIGLLHKIMSHKTRNNVPVIMMSSHDSMGIVFKCLSKGAVDFLVKPIRKNELKNLWQHVWRRCHSSSGSGSESGTQTQKSVKSKGVEKSDNDSGSNDEYDNGSMGLNVGDGSDNGSGTQSSWTKQAIDIDSPLSASVEDQVAICPDSTCAQVIHSNCEVSGSKQAPVVNVMMCGGRKEEIDDACKDKERVVGNVDLKFTNQVEDPTKQKHNFEKGSGKLKEKIDKVNLDLNSKAPASTLNCAANLNSSSANTIGPFVKNVGIEASIRQSKISDSKTNALNDSKDTPSSEHDTPSSEHDLKRPREENEVGTEVEEDRNVLRRSDSSAFLRYNASSNANKTPGVNIKTGCPPDPTLDKTKEGSGCDLQSHSNGDHPNQSSNFDTCSTTNHIIPESSAKYLHPPFVFQPSKGDLLFATQQIQSKKADDVAIRKMLVQPSDVFQDRMCQCLDHNCNHHSMKQQQYCQQPELPPDPHDALVKKMTATIPNCGTGSSNVFGGPVEGTGGNYYSVNNGSGSGSNHGSNEQNGSNGQNGGSTVLNTGGINLESDNGNAGKGGDGSGSGGDGSGSGNENRVDQNKSSQRKAALTKFRQKRSDRCFRKKVRYQSRKRLAEQRPRVRGQFVRQTTNDSSSNGTNGS